MLNTIAQRRSSTGEDLLHRVLDTLRPAAEPTRPAAIRIGVGTFSGLNNGRRRPMFRTLHRQDADQFAPVGVVRVLKKPLPPRVADALFDAAQVTNAMTTLGIAHRVTGPLNAALQLWTLSYRNSWGMIYHNDNQTVLHQVVLGLSPAADALSVDTLLHHRALAPRVLERRYGGVPTAVNIATVAVYFISGVAKVRSPMGSGWASGNALRDQIAADAVRKEVFGSTAPDMAAVLYNHRAPFGLLAVTALAVELGAPISLVDRRAGQVFALCAWGMHWGIRMTMGIKFRYNLSGVCYLSYFPVGRQVPPVRSLFPWR